MYSYGFGRYTKDGISISREEYIKASNAYKNKDSWKPFKTVKECENFLKENVGIPNVKLSTFSKEHSNAFCEVINKVTAKYPLLKNSDVLQCFGDNDILLKERINTLKENLEDINSKDYKIMLHQYHTLLKQYNIGAVGNNISDDINNIGLSLQEQVNFYKQNNLNYTDTISNERISKLITDIAFKFCKQNFINKRSKIITDIAHCDFNVCDGYNGIYINKHSFTNNIVYEYELDVKDGFHPLGTTYKSILTHELGHALSNLLNLKVNAGNEILNYMKELHINGIIIEKELSKYAVNSFDDFISEAFCEYIDSPHPRKIACNIGKIIDNLYKKIEETHK